MKNKKRKETTDAVQILQRRYYQNQPKRQAALEETRINEEIARKISALRTEADLTQKQLAKLAGMTVSEIAALEEADYDGNYLVMLRRIAAVLDKRLELRIVPVKKKLPSGV